MPTVAALAALAAAATGCTSEGSQPSARSGKPDGAGGVPAAEPGKYRTLPEACGTVSLKTLRALLPGADAAAETSEESEEIYEGEATVTYDTDRRVGCRWKSQSPAGSWHLTLDFQRVVSYDPAVSDDDRALQRYAELAVEAHVPDADEIPTTGSSRTPSGAEGGGRTGGAAAQGGQDEPAGPNTSGTGGGDGTGTGTTPGTEGSDEPGTGGAGSAEEPDAGSGSPTTPPSDGGPGDGGGNRTTDAPRSLEDLGDNAFLDDELVTTGAGAHRDITVVFRSSNVIVTIEYDQWSSDKAHTPSSDELQARAEELAQELTGHFDE
ncbi:DUF3558 domain-containing protein [Streptomyces pactum]|uniref:DUF3558 domain-containing protein n=1 Tax=Streptomyces pactum TaxID=68249 RepID=A0ABS0NM73_9ACTN|nr:DUF3558 domain-containing protein [Streptomyces pactum]MBH5336300.1 DUF3558 domain-containing protein [Streptomyces pactum]